MYLEFRDVSFEIDKTDKHMGEDGDQSDVVQVNLPELQLEMDDAGCVFPSFTVGGGGGKERERERASRCPLAGVVYITVHNSLRTRDILECEQDC